MNTQIEGTHTEGMPKGRRAGHDFDTKEYCSSPRCRFIHHYSCGVCGADCTMGTPDGPATTDLDGVTRCNECHRAHAVATFQLHSAAPEMLAALKSVKSLIELAMTDVRLNCEPNLPHRMALAQSLRIEAEKIEAAIAKAEGN